MSFRNRGEGGRDDLAGGRLMKTMLLLLCLSVVCAGQVTLIFTPEPMVVLSALHFRDLGLWTISACNDGAAPIMLAPERFELAAGPRLRIIARERVQAMLERQRERTPASLLMTLAGGGAFVAAGLTGFGPVAAKKEWVASLAWGGALLTQGAGYFKQKIPSLAPFQDSLLKGAVLLGPAECTTRTVFAAKQAGAATFTATIPAAVPAPQVPPSVSRLMMMDANVPGSPYLKIGGRTWVRPYGVP